MTVVYIRVSEFVAGETATVSVRNYGPYASSSEATTALKERGWTQRGSDAASWEIGKVNGDGDAKLATVISIPLSPRNLLPRSG